MSNYDQLPCAQSTPDMGDFYGRMRRSMRRLKMLLIVWGVLFMAVMIYTFWVAEV